jgi:hypothetical protein
LRNESVGKLEKACVFCYNYYMNYKNKKSKSNKKIFFTTITLLMLVLLAFVVYFQFFKDKDSNNSEELEAKTTSLAPTADENFSAGNDRPEQGLNSDKGEAIISDNQGSIDNIPSESNWIKSATGEITLYSPSENQLIKNGDVISGESELSSVSFRIIDDLSGLISTGELAVVDNKFSGSISFSTTASAGRLDIFGSKTDGAEFSNIEVGVRFK